MNKQDLIISILAIGTMIGVFSFMYATNQPVEAHEELGGKLAPVSVSLKVDGKVLTKEAYDTKRVELADKVRDAEPMDIAEYRDVLQIEKEKCHGKILIENYSDSSDKILETFLRRGCPIK